jgi:hypothetical protein
MVLAEIEGHSLRGLTPALDASWGMKRTVNREEIADVLRKWQSGSLSAKDVRDWANDLYSPGGVRFDDWEGEKDNSVAGEVLSALSMLDMNLITAEDIPIYLEFLGTARGAFAEGFGHYEDALTGIDYHARRQELCNDPLYARYCS